MSVKLTDAQAVMVSAAAQREDRCLSAPATIKGAALSKIGVKLAKLGPRDRGKSWSADLAPRWRWTRLRAQIDGGRFESHRHRRGIAFEPHHRVHRRAREEDRALDPHDAVARLSFPSPRQGCGRGTAVSRLWRQTLDGPSNGLVGSMVRARSQGTRTDLIETRSAQPITHDPRVSFRDWRRGQVSDARCLVRPNQRGFGKRNFAARDSPTRSATRGDRSAN
jgi:hypothetical protein